MPNAGGARRSRVACETHGFRNLFERRRVGSALAVLSAFVVPLPDASRLPLVLSSVRRGSRVIQQTPTTPEVVVASETPLLPEAKEKPRGAPKWETDSRDRLKTALRKYIKPLAALVDRDANEGDTRILVTEILTEALGFDKFEDLTTEYQVRGEFADYGIRIDKQLVAFLETKRATTKLAAKHLRQVEMYAVNEGVEWVILTNGVHWQVYHIGMSPGAPVQIDLAIDVDLLGDDTNTHKANQLFFIAKEALKRKRIDELWKEKVATSPRSLVAALFAEPVLSSIRKELRRRTSHQVEEKEIAELLRTTVIRPECIG